MFPAPPAALLKWLLRLLPDAVHVEVLARVLNHGLRGQRLGARLEALDGKSVRLHITDADCFLHLRLQDGRLLPAGRHCADVTIRGTAEDFLALATRREDPDTLFFHRRLAIEGDTETGLTVKNLLDAFEYDWEAHFRDVLGPGLAGLLAPLGRRLARRAAPGTAAERGEQP
jgi:predicted lipid carrier protein YhbT